MLNTMPMQKTLVELVRFGMTKETNADKACHYAGISRRTYQLIRKLLILKDRKLLSKTEEDTIDHTIQILESTKGRRNFKTIKAMTQPIISHYWQENTHDGQYRDRSLAKDTVKMKKRLEKTLFAIRETCSNNEEMEIPVALTGDERTEYRELLIESINSLWQLMHKIKGENR